MFSFFRRAKPEREVVFDIGSSSVRAGLVTFLPHSIPRVEYVVREPIASPADLDPKRFFKSMIEALTLASTGALKASAGQRLHRIVFTLSSPWVATQTKIVTIEKPEPFVVTKQIIDAAIRDIEQSFEASSINTTPDQIADRVSVMERHIIQTALNGYPVESPYGKKARKVDISFFTSIAPRTVLDAIRDSSIRIHHSKKSEMYSFPLVAFSVLRDIHHHLDDFLLISVGGELTDISIIKNGLIVESASFPSGFNFLIRKVAHACTMSDGQAESLLRLHFEGHGAKDVSEKLNPVLDEASKEWSTSLHTVLAHASSIMSLPQELFLVVSGDMVRFFIESVKGEKVAQLGLEEVPFSVTLVNADKLRPYVSFASHVHKDPIIGMIAAFLNSKRALDGSEK